MKKIFIYIFCTLSLLSLCACQSGNEDETSSLVSSSDDAQNSSSESESELSENDEPTISIDPEKTQTIVLSNFVITTIGADPSDIAKSLNIDSVVKNSDGSVTYYLTPAEKTEILSTMRTSLSNYIASLKLSEDYDFIDDISINSTYDLVYINSTAEKYNKQTDTLIAPEIYIPVLTYVAFSAEEYRTFSDFEINFIVLNEDNSANLDEFSYPATLTPDNHDEESATDGESEDDTEKELPDVSRGDDIP